MRFVLYRRLAWRGVCMRLALALVLAVAVDFAIAYGCSRWSPRRARFADITGFKDEPPAEGIQFEPLSRGWSRIAMVEYGPGYEYYAVLAVSDRKRQTTTGFGNGLRLEAGLPFRSWLVVSDKAPVWPAGLDYRGHFWSGPSIFAKPNGTVTRLRPLFPGFLQNVSIGFALLAGVLFAPLAARSVIWRHRRRAGLCIQCGYPVEGHATCPECGNENSR